MKKGGKLFRSGASAMAKRLASASETLSDFAEKRDRSSRNRNRQTKHKWHPCRHQVQRIRNVEQIAAAAIGAPAKVLSNTAFLDAREKTAPHSRREPSGSSCNAVQIEAFACLAPCPAAVLLNRHSFHRKMSVSSGIGGIPPCHGVVTRAKRWATRLAPAVLPGRPRSGSPFAPPFCCR